ncbi:14332_t:CDS:2, partial [Funneliformis geosporum]
REDIKDASTLIRKCFNIDYYQTISEFETYKTSGNDIDDEITEALAHTCHKLEHFKLDDTIAKNAELRARVVKLEQDIDELRKELGSKKIVNFRRNVF